MGITVCESFIRYMCMYLRFYNEFGCKRSYIKFTSRLHKSVCISITHKHPSNHGIHLLRIHHSLDFVTYKYFSWRLKVCTELKFLAVFTSVPHTKKHAYALYIPQKKPPAENRSICCSNILISRHTSVTSRLNLPIFSKSDDPIVLQMSRPFFDCFPPFVPFNFGCCHMNAC